MADRAARERELRHENRRLKASLSAIHDALHADDANRAHELCECALAGETVSQPNLTVADAARSHQFASSFNQLAERAGVMACCVMLLPSSTVEGATSVQLCGNVAACKVVEGLMRGKESTYMGDHGGGPQPVEIPAPGEPWDGVVGKSGEPY
jgi:hypothetical protein